MTPDIKVPETFSQRIKKLKNSGYKFPHPDSPQWYSREANEKSQAETAWGAPYDARFPQQRKQRMCFTYYVDFYRCRELMGNDYKPCAFFNNVYRDICPKFWIEKWDELRTTGRFPAKFDR